jgi:hypothetical protein
MLFAAALAVLLAFRVVHRLRGQGARAAARP